MDTRPQNIISANHVELPLVGSDATVKCTFKTPTIKNVRNYRAATREISAASDGYDEKLEALKQANTDKSALEQKLKTQEATKQDVKQLQEFTARIELLTAELEACDVKSYDRLCKRLFDCINVPNNDAGAKRVYEDIDWLNTSVADINEASGFFVKSWSGARASTQS